MKKFFFLAFTALAMVSCSDDDDNSPGGGGGGSFATEPEAKVEFDGSNFGIYKGVFVGSSGYVYINLNNEGNISAMMNIDGTTYNFTTEETIALDEDVTDLTFTSGDYSFDFNVTAEGIEPTITNIMMDDHPFAFAEVIKEYSNELVKVYNGTYTGDSNGVFNLLSINNSLYGLAKPSDDENSKWLEATLNNDGNISGSFGNGTFTGAMNGNNMNGSWSMGSEDGNWSVQRKL